MRDFLVVALEELTNGEGFVLRGDSVYENVEWIGTKHSKEVVMARVKELQDAEPMRILRIKRAKVLGATDKYMTIDYPMTEEERTAMRGYRQVLRDLPQEGITEIPEVPDIIKKFLPSVMPVPVNKPEEVVLDETEPTSNIS
jgi:hypothetical protein